MSLQKKTLSVVLFTFAALVLVLYILVQLLLGLALSNVEAISTQHDLTRARNALITNLRALEGTTRDWSLWNATYEFVKDQNQNYIDENMPTTAVMDANQLNLMLFVDEHAGIVYVRAYDYRHGEDLTLWPELASEIYPGSPLLQHPDSGSSITGIFELSDSFLLLASEPIIPLDRPATIGGSLLFGRLLDKATLEHLGQNILSKVQLYSLAKSVGEHALPPEEAQVLTALEEGVPQVTLPLSETEIAAFALLDGMYSSPEYVMRIDVNRNAYSQAKVAINLFMLVLLVIGLIFAVVVGITLHKIVLARLGRLRAQVTTISDNQDMASRVEAKGSDELADLANRINGMLDSLRRAQIKQMEGDKRFRNTFQVNPSAEILTRLSDGKVIDVNQAFLELTGYSRSEVIDTDATQWNGWIEQEQLSSLTELVREQGFARGHEMTFITRLGENKSVLVSVQPVEIGGEACLLSAGLDISGHKKAEELRSANKVAEQTNRAKTEFLSRMSHELRTPLNSVLGYAQLLKVCDPTPDQEEQIEYILKGGQHLLGLINEVLDIARIDSGSISTSIEPIDVGEVLDECIDIIKPLADRYDVAVSLHRPTGPETTTIEADRQRVKQVILNLLANAVKYNRPGGRVSISCAWHSSATASINNQDDKAGNVADDAGRASLIRGENNRLRIVIEDNGIGIPAEKMPLLFIPFERLGAENGEVEGTGLGLSLAKRLTEAMGGEIGAESEHGRGSRFWVEWSTISVSPEAELEYPLQQRAEQGVLGRLAGYPGQILYIEDNLHNICLVESILTGSELTVVPATQGQAGLELARQLKPSVILLDLHLPDISGEDVLKQLQSDPATASIPVLVLSADAIPKRIQQMLAAGARGYLTKPLNIREFVRVLARQLDGANSTMLRFDVK